MGRDWVLLLECEFFLGKYVLFDISIFWEDVVKMDLFYKIMI